MQLPCTETGAFHTCSILRGLHETFPKVIDGNALIQSHFRHGDLKPELFELARTVAKIKGDIAANENRLWSLREQERKAQVKAKRNAVTAPQDGVVMNLRIHTPGGVVAPGGVILDLVPARDKLVLEVKIQPIDIDVVRPDLPATVRFVAYKQRTTPVVEGRVTRVSADAVTEERTEDILRYIRTNGHEGRVAPHVHYLEKALALELRHKLWPWALQRSGRLVRAIGTFIEDVSEDDLRRQWLFKPENGGIFMDWIHPSAMLANVCGAHFEACEEATAYVVNPAYDPANPTGIEARFRLTGEHLAPGATATIRVGKGFPPGVRYKRLRLEFERGAVLELAFTDTEKEIETGQKGNWTFDDNGSVEKGRATGPSSYELLVDEMLGMIEKRKAPLSLAEMREIYRPVWLCLAAVDTVVRADAGQVEDLMRRAIALKP